MNIVVIGWYGTETLGDRAILAGLLSFIAEAYDDIRIQLGSLYPFFTERTLHEDSDLWHKICGKKLDIELFDSKNMSSLNKAIKRTDMLVMGGGPLMHIEPIFMIEYAFMMAKKWHKKTAILGCGVGPLFTARHQKSVISIIRNSDIIVLRDRVSLTNLETIHRTHNNALCKRNIIISYDLSLRCILLCKSYVDRNDTQRICINLRSFPKDYSKGNQQSLINDTLTKFVGELSSKYLDSEIKLVPMHYFHVGGDDRQFLNMVAQQVKKAHVCVQNDPLDLRNTMEMYKGAKINIGMRFHAVVFQTLLSGKNYILDYTEPSQGKIAGFVNRIDANSVMKKRYINLQEDSPSAQWIKVIDKPFNVDGDTLLQKMGVYVKKLRELANESTAHKCV